MVEADLNAVLAVLHGTLTRTHIGPVATLHITGGHDA